MLKTRGNPCGVVPSSTEWTTWYSGCWEELCEMDIVRSIIPVWGQIRPEGRQVHRRVPRTSWNGRHFLFFKLKRSGKVHETWRARRRIEWVTFPSSDDDEKIPITKCIEVTHKWNAEWWLEQPLTKTNKLKQRKRNGRM